MSVALCINTVVQLEVDSLPRAEPPLYISPWHLRVTTITLVCNETDLFSAAGNHETIPSSSKAFSVTMQGKNGDT